MTVSIETDDGVDQIHENCNPLDVIEVYQKQFKVPEIEGLPRFSGGLVGYFWL